MTGDTIFALSSGAPPAAIAVMRVSGPGASDAVRRLAGGLPKPRHATVRTLRDLGERTLDRALVLWLPGPRTVTGEDVAELHLHGGRATIAAVERALRELGLRPAVGGEFTRRALSNGCVDLAQVQGLADLLAAETEDHRRYALAASEGQVSRAVQQWYDRLVTVGALIEGQLDHADEGDVAPADALIGEELRTLAAEMEEVLSRPTVERARDGVVVVLAGPPNAGKSSLFNAMLERDAAIVTPVAGTTRDVLEAAVIREGRCYRLVDTAGETETDDPVERIGVARAVAVRKLADVVVWLGDEAPPLADVIWVNARCDLPGREQRPGSTLSISAQLPSTVTALWNVIDRRAGDRVGRSLPFLLANRQRDLVHEAHRQITNIAFDDELLIAEAVRTALHQLDQLLGRYAPEAVLTSLFSRFCIGK